MKWKEKNKQMHNLIFVFEIKNKQYLLDLIDDILKSLQLISVNQIAAQIKLTEMWKALNDSQYPLRVEQKSETEDGIGTRSMTSGDLI
jgi:hypothetical protein